MYNSNNNVWLGAIKYWLKKENIKEYLTSNMSKTNIPNKFYEAIINLWSDMKNMINPTKEK